MPMGRDQALYAIGRVLGNPGRIELEGGNSELVLVPNVMVETVSRTSSLEKLFDALCRGLARVREQEQLHHRYLEWERQRHSRPMPVQANTAAPQPALSRAPRLAPHPVTMRQRPTVPTIPMALPTR